MRPELEVAKLREALPDAMRHATFKSELRGSCVECSWSLGPYAVDVTFNAKGTVEAFLYRNGEFQDMAGGSTYVGRTMVVGLFRKVYESLTMREREALFD